MLNGSLVAIVTPMFEDGSLDFAAAAKYEEIVRSLLINIANDQQRPKWKQDSFFRRYAAGN